MPEFLGVVVLYQPDSGVVDRIQSYLKDLSKLLVVDNSEEPSPIVTNIQQLGPQVTVIPNQSNVGIARALNQAVDYGIKNGFDWLLTMDQDSEFVNGALTRMKDYIQSVDIKPGIVSPFHQTPGGRLPPSGVKTKNVRIAMTSGNLLNLSAARECGPFEEKLFIDSVDHEYCLRLRKKGYLITQLNDAVLNHKLGEIEYRRVYSIRLKTSNHGAIRRYYMTRNRLFVVTKYLTFDFHFAWRELTELTKSFWAVALFEKHKAEKLRAMLKGVWHFMTGRYGKI